MNRGIQRLIFIWSVTSVGSPLGAAEAPAEKVFLYSVDGPIVLDVDHNDLRIRKPNYAADGNTLVVDGRNYPIDWSAIRSRPSSTRPSSSSLLSSSKWIR